MNQVIADHIDTLLEPTIKAIQKRWNCSQTVALQHLATRTRERWDMCFPTHQTAAKWIRNSPLTQRAKKAITSDENCTHCPNCDKFHPLHRSPQFDQFKDGQHEFIKCDCGTTIRLQWTKDKTPRQNR